MTFENPATETPGPGDRARVALAGSRFADVRWVETTGSTNTDLLDLARDGAGEGVVLVADHQSAGRGRLGRTWQAPPGASLLSSVLLRPEAAVADAVTMATGLALVHAVRAVAGVEAKLKWPNDLVASVDGEDRKLAGILAEVDWPARANVSAGWSPPPPGERVAVVVGSGVNVNWPAAVPDELAGLLTACNHLAGRDVDRVELLVEFLRGLDERYSRLRADPLADRGWLRDEWRANAATLGRRVRVDLGAGDLVGTAIDIDDAGRLVVETLEGETKAVAVGDVVHLRSPSD